MRVFALEAYGNYGGGLAIVAAEDESAAKQLASKIRDGMWNVQYGKPTEISVLPSIVHKGAAEVIYHYETGE